MYWSVLKLCTPCPSLRAAPGPVIRLTGGNTPNEGRVEVFYNGTWGTVCDDSADLNVGDVVCRELGHERALRVYGDAVFGPGTGKVCGIVAPVAWVCQCSQQGCFAAVCGTTIYCNRTLQHFTHHKWQNQP